MSYRRKSEKERRWKVFRDGHSTLAGEAGLPDEYLAREDVFIEFLLHGFVREVPGSQGFLSDEMPPVQYQKFLDLVHRYFSAGFPYFTPMAVCDTAEQDKLERLFGNR